MSFNKKGWTLLDWSRSQAFDYPDMVFKSVNYKGVNSFFHALLQAYNKVYINEQLDNKFVDREDFVKALRNSWGKKLKEFSGSGRLQDGPLRPIINRESVSIERLAEELEDDTVPFRICWIGIICYFLDLDIYILERETWSLFIYTEEEETYFLKPGHRNVVVLLKELKGYSTVGIVTEDEEVATLFDPNSKFIRTIRKELHHKRDLIKRVANSRPAVPPTITNIPDGNRVNLYNIERDIT